MTSRAVTHRESITHIEEFAAPASAVWAVLIDWGAILDWMPGGYITNLELEGKGIGAIRRLVTGQDVPVAERLDAADAATGVLELSLVDDLPWGLLSYRATGHVEALSDTQCRLTWQGTLEMQESDPETRRVAAMLKKSYATMFLGIRRVVETS
jgi:hypothetical protein